MRRLVIAAFILMSLPIFQASWAMDMTQFVRISSTLSGPSGLLLTQSIDTLEPGRFEFGLGLTQEEGGRSAGPDLSISKVSSTFTVGLSHTMEVSLQIPYFAKIDGGGADENRLGDVNLSLKWRFLEPSTDRNLPGFGLSLTSFFPTGDRKIGAGAIESWGIKALLLSSAETEVGLSGKSLLVGFYANGGIYTQDAGDVTTETHGIFDLGLLIPLNMARNIHFLLEGSARTGLETRFGKDYIGVLAGLRYVTKHASWSAGYQRRFNDEPLDDSNLFLLQGGYFF